MEYKVKASLPDGRVHVVQTDTKARALHCWLIFRKCREYSDVKIEAKGQSFGEGNMEELP